MGTSPKNTFRIAILGVGGVGGYFGGKLAAHYSGSDKIEIIFIARGENENAIRENGLKLISSKGDQIVHPHHVSNDPDEIGRLDLLLCCTKSYGLVEGLRPLEKNIHDHTIILPLLNGVENSEIIKNIFPNARVWQGCVYLVSRLIAPGIIKESGNIEKLFFGAENENADSLKEVEGILNEAGIAAKFAPDILTTMWNKFAFISPIATLTSALDLSIGQILQSELHKETLQLLVMEVREIAKAKKISLSEDIIHETFARAEKLPYEATSSMHTDFQKGNNTEMDALTAYVVRQGKKLNVSVPLYENMLWKLNEKSTH